MSMKLWKLFVPLGQIQLVYTVCYNNNNYCIRTSKYFCKIIKIECFPSQVTILVSSVPRGQGLGFFTLPPLESRFDTHPQARHGASHLNLRYSYL